MSRRWRRPTGDDGQLTTGLMVLVSLGLLFVVMRVILPIGQAADQRTTAQTASDAAALAAAEQLKTDIPQVILTAVAQSQIRADLPGLLQGVNCGSGSGAAQNYAASNNADVVTYCYVPANDRIEVRVRSRDVATTGGRAESTAVAGLGVRLGNCYLTDDPPPAPDPDDDDADPENPPEDDDPDEPPPPPPPPPNVGTLLRCGDLTLHFTIDGKTHRPKLDTPLTALTDRFEVRLID
jgi:hypothetical protein